MKRWQCCCKEIQALQRDRKPVTKRVQAYYKEKASLLQGDGKPVAKRSQACCKDMSSLKKLQI
jgi:hypothetical protein